MCIGLNVSWVLSSLLSPHRKAVNYYELLGVKSDASLEEIKNAFFDKSRKVGNVLPDEGSIVCSFQLFPQWAS